MRVYLLVHNEPLRHMQFVQSIMSCSSVAAWRYETNTCFYLLSNLSAVEIGNELESKVGGFNYYILTEVSSNYWGKASTDTWKMFSEKVLPPQQGYNVPPPPPSLPATW